MEFISESLNKTKEIAENVASTLVPGTVLTLTGDLGSGKTTFTKYLVEALDIPSRVQSPTFVLVRSYKGGKGVVKEVHHVDLYRIASVEEMDDLGISDLFNESDSVVVIEWPEIAKDVIPPNAMNINFSYVDEDTRRIDVQD